jgi:hypothetical protein
MSERDIPEAEWAAFLDGFSREHRAWLATVDRVRAGAPEHGEAFEQPLAAVVPQTADHRVERIEIRFQDVGTFGHVGAAFRRPEASSEESRPHEPIQVDAPATVRVNETADGVARGLDIVARDGACTRLRFRAAPRMDMLDGIAPGELTF